MHPQLKNNVGYARKLAGQLAEYKNRELPDFDGEYFFPKGGLVRAVDLIPILRKEKADIIRGLRLSRIWNRYRHLLQDIQKRKAHRDEARFRHEQRCHLLRTYPFLESSESK